MSERPHNPIKRRCTCGCPIHHGRPRLFFTDPGCACVINCTSQPLTVHSPQTGGALFLDRTQRLWHVPALRPGRWDWNAAIHSVTDAGYPLADLERELTGLLTAAAEALAALDIR